MKSTRICLQPTLVEIIRLSGVDDKEAVDAVVDERVENRVMGIKKRKIGDTVELVDSRPDRSLPVENVTPLGSPTPISQSKDQDKGRLQMLLKRALVERTNQAIDIEDPKDRICKHLLEEMMLVEWSFTHSLQEIEMWDERIVKLED